MFDVIAVGSAVLDLNLVFEKMPGFNEHGNILQTSWQGGGKVSTGIVATARLGDFKCAFAGALGGSTGRVLRDDFVRHNIDVSHCVDHGRDNVFTLTIADKSNGGRSFCPTTPFSTNPKMTAEEVDEAFIADTKYVFIAQTDPASTRAAELAHKHGAKVIVDADSFDKGFLDNAKYYDYLIPSEFFYRSMFGDSNDHAANLKKMREYGNDDLVIINTLGENGLIGLDENGEFFSLPAFKIDVVDTTGAGDVFHGAFVAGLLHGMDVKTSAKFSSAVSAIKCTSLGGRAGIPTYDVVMKFLETGVIDRTEIDERVKYYSKMPL